MEFELRHNCLARLQAPESAADKTSDQQESDATSQEVSVDTPSPRRNGTITNFQSPVHPGNSIHTISQSASRANLNRGSVCGSVRTQAVTILPKHRLEHRPEHIPNRKMVRSLHPVEAAGIITAHSYGGRRGHTTRYVIVNEREPRKKLLRSTTRIPRHYLMEEPAEILELYPRNIRRYTSRTTHHPPHSHRPHTSQHLTGDDEEDQGRGQRRVSLGKTSRPRSLSDLHQQARFYIGDQIERHNDWCEGTYGTQEDGEKDGDKEDWPDLDFQSPSRASVRASDPHLARARSLIHSPGRPEQSQTRSRHTEVHVKHKLRPKLETPLTESDSASVASSSDQQNSSTDQYIQVIHSKERFVKSDGKQDKLSKKKSKTSFDLNPTESMEFVCSNV